MTYLRIVGLRSFVFAAASGALPRLSSQRFRWLLECAAVGKHS
jgi:hypothetical protein